LAAEPLVELLVDFVGELVVVVVFGDDPLGLCFGETPPVPLFEECGRWWGGLEAGCFLVLGVAVV
jgi:hypothetical protein